MVDSVQGRPQQPQLDTVSRPLEDQTQSTPVEKPDSVSIGYDQENSFSHRTGGPLIQLPPEAEHPPTLTKPATTNYLVPGEVQNPLTHGETSQARHNLDSGLSQLETNHPFLATPEVKEKFKKIGDKLGSLQEGSPDKLASIRQATEDLATKASEGTLDADQLEQILTELQTKLEDSSFKFAEQKIEIQAEQNQKTRAENIADMRASINESKENKGLFGLKIAAAAIFPPLGIWEGIMAITREVEGKDNGLSIFSSSRARKTGLDKAESDFESAGNAIGDYFKRRFRARGSRGGAEAIGMVGVPQPTTSRGRNAGLAGSYFMDQKINSAEQQLGLPPLEPSQQVIDGMSTGRRRGRRGRRGRRNSFMEPPGITAYRGERLARLEKELGITPPPPSLPSNISGRHMTPSLIMTNHHAQRLQAIEEHLASRSSSSTTTQTQSTKQDPDETAALKTATDGLTVAESGLSQIEMMKLLQQIKESEENKEKLQEAIAALQGGDIEAAKSALQSIPGAPALDGIDDASTLLNNLNSVATDLQQHHEDTMAQTGLIQSRNPV